MTSLRQLGKRMRAWMPLNYVATTIARGVTSTVGWHPEFLPRHLHKVGEVTCDLPNGTSIKLWSRGDDWVSNRVFWFGWRGYEPESVGVFAALARTASVVFDIGSYVGFYSLVAARMNGAAVVHAFEPMPAIFARLENNLRLNALANVSAHRMAMGDSNGAAEFFHSTVTELPTSSSLSRDFTDNQASLVSISVDVMRLDDFVAERKIDRVDLMKIDTETTEAAVLRGGERTLYRHRPHIVCEVLAGRAPQRDLEAILSPCGYHYYMLTPEGPILRDAIEGHPEFLNYLFTTLTEGDLRSRLQR